MAYVSYRELLDDPAIDAVYIPLPNELHKTVGRWRRRTPASMCSARNRFALDAREAKEMVEHCRRRGVILMEAFMWRHQPRSLELNKLVRSGGDWRAAFDPFVVFVPDRSRRLAARSIARRGAPSLTSAAMG